MHIGQDILEYLICGEWKGCPMGRTEGHCWILNFYLKDLKIPFMGMVVQEIIIVLVPTQASTIPQTLKMKES